MRLGWPARGPWASLSGPHPTVKPVPDLGGEADDGKEHSVDVEVAEEPFDDDAVDGERDLRDAEVEADADDVALLQTLLRRPHHPRLARCHRQTDDAEIARHASCRTRGQFVPVTCSNVQFSTYETNVIITKFSFRMSKYV